MMIHEQPSSSRQVTTSAQNAATYSYLKKRKCLIPMPQFKIGPYFEWYQGHPTSTIEEVIKADTKEEARKIAEEKYGWGAWCTEIKGEAA